jgi:hypothetical protein
MHGTLRVSLYGPVEWKAVASTIFIPLAVSALSVQTGEELRTGHGGIALLELRDGSDLVVPENTTFTIPDFFSPNALSRVHLMMGKLHFYVQLVGGRPNVKRALIPTALIAVRG